MLRIDVVFADLVTDMQWIGNGVKRKPYSLIMSILNDSGEAEAILATVEATAKGSTTVSQTPKEYGSVKYIQAFNEVAMMGKTLLLPATSVADPATMIVVALCVYRTLIGKDSVIELPGISTKHNDALVTGDVMKSADVKPLAL